MMQVVCSNILLAINHLTALAINRTDNIIFVLDTSNSQHSIIGLVKLVKTHHCELPGIHEKLLKMHVQINDRAVARDEPILPAKFLEK